MSGAQHTPGPWQALYVGCEKAVLIGTVDGVTAFARMERFDGTPSDEAQEANAALIAAAPDMLSALQFVSGYIEGQIATEVAGLESPPIHWETLVEAVNAAIAKAEGRMNPARFLTLSLIAVALVNIKVAAGWSFLP